MLSFLLSVLIWCYGFITVVSSASPLLRNVNGHLELETITTSQGITITDTVTYMRLGTAVSANGDVNGDGYADILLGAPTASSQSNPATCYLAYGGPNLKNFTVQGLVTPSKGITLTGASSQSQAGYSVSIGGSVNSDKYGDMLIAAPGSHGSSFVATTYLIYGGTNLQNIVLSSLSASQGISITGSVYDVIVGGDANGDGYADMFITNNGAAYLIYGGPSLASFSLSALQTPSKGIVIKGLQTGAFIAGSLSGSVNGDQYADMLIGVSVANTYTGAVYLIYGGNALVNVSVTHLLPSQGIVITGGGNYWDTGFSVSIGGDANGDGYGDMLIGAIGGTGSTLPYGAAYLIYGGANLKNISLANLKTPSQGIIMSGDPKNNVVGLSVGMGGNINGDQYADLVIAGNGNGTGKTYVVYGGPALNSFSLSSMSASQGYNIYGPTKSSGFGIAVNVGNYSDVNKDGKDDILIGANLYNSYQGSSYLIYGASSSPQNLAVGSSFPTGQPSRQPSRQPTAQPSRQPSRQPTGQPSRQPTQQPVGRPSGHPTGQPTRRPSNRPSGQPTRLPSAQPSRFPSARPSSQPSGVPSISPSSFPTSSPSCVAGEYGLGGGKCVLCPPGTSGALGATGSCSLCAIGTYQDQSGQSDCNECPYPWSNVEEVLRSVRPSIIDWMTPLIMY
jgi:hypothetical protein